MSGDKVSSVAHFSQMTTQFSEGIPGIENVSGELVLADNKLQIDLLAEQGELDFDKHFIEPIPYQSLSSTLNIQLGETSWQLTSDNVNFSSEQLKVNSQPWCQLKENMLLASLKQRFAIQGGSSSFDLPQLQFWLHQSETHIARDIEQWLSLLNNIKHSLALVLKFIRQRAGFECIETESGFYQDNGEGLLLLRIKVAQSAQYFPTISGNRFRYSIRFMLPCEQKGRRYSNQATKFKLARC